MFTFSCVFSFAEREDVISHLCGHCCEPQALREMRSLMPLSEMAAKCQVVSACYK